MTNQFRFKLALLASAAVFAGHAWAQDATSTDNTDEEDRTLDTVVVAALAFLAITIIVGGEREADSGKEHGRQKKGPIFHVNVG